MKNAAAPSGAAEEHRQASSLVPQHLQSPAQPRDVTRGLAIGTVDSPQMILGGEANATSSPPATPLCGGAALGSCGSADHTAATPIRNAGADDGTLPKAGAPRDTAAAVDGCGTSPDSEEGEVRILRPAEEEPVAARPVRREPNERGAPPVRTSPPELWSDDELEEMSVEGQPTTTLKRENRRSSSGAATGKRGAGGKKGGRRSGLNAGEAVEQERKKAGPCLTCLGLLFANCWLLSMIASVLLPLLYDGFPTNEVDYW